MTKTFATRNDVTTDIELHIEALDGNPNDFNLEAIADLAYEHSDEHDAFIRTADRYQLEDIILDNITALDLAAILANA